MRAAHLAVLSLLLGCSSGNQASTSPAPKATPAVATTCTLEQGTVVLRTEFASTTNTIGDNAALALQAGCIYSATTDVSGIQLQIRPMYGVASWGHFTRLSERAMTGGQTWEIRPTSSGKFEIWFTNDPAPPRLPVQLEVTVRGSFKS